MVGVRRYFEARHPLARQQADKELEHAEHCCHYATRVDHLADGKQPACECHDHQRRQYQGDSVNRSNGGKKFDVAGAHRAEGVEEEHQAESEDESAQTCEQTLRSAEDRVKRETADKSDQHKLVGNTPVAHIHVSDDGGHWYEQSGDGNILRVKHFLVFSALNNRVGLAGKLRKSTNWKELTGMAADLQRSPVTSFPQAIAAGRPDEPSSEPQRFEVCF